MTRFLLTLTALGAFLITPQSTAQSPAPNAAAYRIGVLQDGPSWYFDRSLDQIAAELHDLAGESVTFIHPTYDAGHDPKKIPDLLQRALEDDAVDLIYACGVMATEAVKQLPDAQRVKPIMAGAIQFSDVGGLITPEGVSSKPNLTFITEPTRVSSDLALLGKLTGRDSVHVLIDELVFEAFDKLPEALAQFREKLEIDIHMHPVGQSIEEALDALPETAGLPVYVPLMPRIESSERQRLYEELAQRGAITVAMFGHEEVPLGALAGLATDLSAPIARRTALNMLQMLQGVPADNLSVYLPVQDRLIINARTAQNTPGWSPTYEIALEADFYGDEVYYDGEPINIDQAMRRARANNVEVAIASAALSSQVAQLNIARSGIRPRIDLSADARQATYDSRIDPIMPERQGSASYGAQLRQVLFSDAIFTNIRAQRLGLEASQWERRSQELDAMEAAAVAFLNVLSARALYNIERENLRLTQNNLQLAQLRVEIGSAEPSEIFRWQQDVATSRARLFQRETDRINAVIGFNRILGEADPNLQHSFQDIEVGPDDFYLLEDRLSLIKTRDFFISFGSYLGQLALNFSPELKAFQATIGAQTQVYAQQRRRTVLPEVSGFAGADRTLANNEFINPRSEGALSVGVQLSFPLFEGGQRKAEIDQQAAEVARLMAQRLNAEQLILQSALSIYQQLGASHPNIRLSQEAEEASIKNYQAVREKYSFGAASILDLLDAQATRIQRRRDKELAVYDYLIHVFQFQRALSWFEFEEEDPDWHAHADAVYGFFDSPPNESVLEPIDTTQRRLNETAAPKIPEALRAEPQRKGPFRFFRRKK